jgi:hypothetical protein
MELFAEIDEYHVVIITRDHRATEGSKCFEMVTTKSNFEAISDKSHLIIKD